MQKGCFGWIWMWARLARAERGTSGWYLQRDLGSRMYVMRGLRKMGKRKAKRSRVNVGVISFVSLFVLLTRIVVAVSSGH